jgi:hypothetical protein
MDCYDADDKGEPTCQWTGAPVVPPAGYVAKSKPPAKGQGQGQAVRAELEQPSGQAKGQGAGRKLLEGDASRAGRLLQQTCATRCANSKMPAGCSITTTPMAQGPSCK